MSLVAAAAAAYAYRRHLHSDATELVVGIEYK